MRKCRYVKLTTSDGTIWPTCLFCFLAVLDPRFGHTMDVLSVFIPVLSLSDWLFHRESCPRLNVAVVVVLCVDWLVLIAVMDGVCVVVVVLCVDWLVLIAVMVSVRWCCGAACAWFLLLLIVVVDAQLGSPTSPATTTMFDLTSAATNATSIPQFSNPSSRRGNCRLVTVTAVSYCWLQVMAVLETTVCCVL